jgi:hypothetical protein
MERSPKRLTSANSTWIFPTMTTRSTKTKFTPSLAPSPQPSAVSALYKPETTAVVMDQTVRFIPPSQVQIALMMQFLLLAIQDLVSTVKDRQELSRAAVFQRCMNRISLNIKDDSELTEEERRQKLEVNGSLLLNPGANNYLFEAVSHCFPEFPRPELLNDEALMSMMILIMNHFNDLLKT